MSRFFGQSELYIPRGPRVRPLVAEVRYVVGYDDAMSSSVLGLPGTMETSKTNPPDTAEAEKL